MQALMSTRFQKEFERIYSVSPEETKAKLDRIIFRTVLEQLKDLEEKGKLKNTLEYLMASGYSEEEIIQALR